MSRSLAALAARVQLNFKLFGSLDALGAAGEPLRDVVVLSSGLPASNIPLVRNAAAGGSCRFLFISKKELTATQRALVAEIPHATFVEGGPHFVARVTAAAAQLCGVPARVVPRVVPNRHGRPVGTMLFDDVESTLEVENLSESGVKVIATSCPPLGCTVRLALELTPGPVRCSAEVVRAHLGDDNRWRLGLRFLWLRAPDRAVIGELVKSHPAMGDVPAYGPLRAAHRARSKLAVKARIDRQHPRARWYLDLVELTEEGFTARAKVALEIPERCELSATLLTRSNRLHLPCTLSAKTDGKHFLFLFAPTLDPEQRAGLTALGELAGRANS